MQEMNKIVERNDNCELKLSRRENVRSLGFLCYNLYTDGLMNFSEMDDIVKEIKWLSDYVADLKNSGDNKAYAEFQEKKLDEKLMELGCICYNLYVDRKLFNNELLSLCDSISSLNKELVSETADDKNKTASGFGLLEPIPLNYKKCSVCGYKNRAEAKYCGKCGKKLI